MFHMETPSNPARRPRVKTHACPPIQQLSYSTLEVKRRVQAEEEESSVCSSPPKNKQNSGGDIVFTARDGGIHTIPCLGKRLKSATETIIGLQYVWEYRSPSKSVPPHYMCKLCNVQQLQNEITPHIVGWKHAFRYMKQHHSDKVPYEEEAVSRDAVIRKEVKAAAAEIEKTEGRGQIKVVVKEPADLEIFKGMKSAHPNPVLSKLEEPPHKMSRPDGSFGRHFKGPNFMGDFKSRGGMRSDFSPGMLGAIDDFSGRYSERFGNGMSGPDRMVELETMSGFPVDRFRGSDHTGHCNEDRYFTKPMNCTGDQMMGPGRKAPENSNVPATLLQYLDSFRIDNEEDAQIVLKVTQKLTDILMEYRLRSISALPSVKPLPSMNYSAMPPSRSSDRYSSGMSAGSSRYK
ncbi:hypothetical protein DNTS_001331 [Danionella cerebrum]|uniref:Uncharacterized protein n=1 Tax=Danionella cerebrum TaxID=2873325 RepID=A0A553Q3V1_9TELE|nr:hypothetical protein DNTS_001331 [Danionella translucida]